jgi:hypothetical protein
VDASGTLTGIGTGNGTSVANNVTENGIQRIPHPLGGTLQSSGTTNGALWIVLPEGWNNTMLRFDIEVYEYETGSVSTYTVGGYVYQGGAWYNTSATYNGPPGKSRRVTFGVDGPTQRPMVAIGQFAGSFQYPQVKVSNLVAGYNGGSSANWRAAFDLSFTTSRSYTEQSYISNPTPGGAMSGIDMLTAANVSTFIQGAAIGYAQIGVLRAANLSVQALSDTVNGGLSSGGRVEIQSNKVLVYDATGALRVKLGYLL